MRIIGGKLKGLRIQPPKNLPVRPTTDQAKEALFNILHHQLSFEALQVLDLFSGTGNMSLEFLSRGVKSLQAVDLDFGCINFLKQTAKQHQISNIEVTKADVFKYLSSEKKQYDLIFADPPYDLLRIPEIPKLVFDLNLLTNNGLLIVEHQSMQNLSNHQNFIEQRKYGYASFSFFSHPK